MAKNTASTTQTDQTADLYDFSNLDDLPEELQRKLHTETSDRAAVYADIVNNAPRALNISEVIAVAIRKFGKDNVPGPQTIRSYLNSAVQSGLISKPSRQTYGPGSGEGTVTATETPKDAAPQADESDPLSKIS